MSINFRSSIPTLVFCAGVVLFIMGWRRLGLVVAVTPVLIGVLVVIWALVRSSDDDS